MVGGTGRGQCCEQGVRGLGDVTFGLLVAESPATMP